MKIARPIIKEINQLVIDGLINTPEHLFPPLGEYDELFTEIESFIYYAVEDMTDALTEELE